MKKNRDEIILGFFVSPLVVLSYFFDSIAIGFSRISDWLDIKTDYLGVWVITKFKLNKIRFTNKNEELNKLSIKGRE